MKETARTLAAALVMLWLGMAAASAQGNIEVDTPAVSALKNAMQARHGLLAAHYASGAIGVARDGGIQMRDANAVPLAQRQQVSNLVAAENADRAALYREVARANGHPEWEEQVRGTFAQRWIDKAQSGWYVQDAAGQWARK
jgi:uncharacterized protein YdbL (DUF1318 family)